MHPTIDTILENARKRILALQVTSLSQLIDFLEGECTFISDIEPRQVVDVAIQRGYLRIVSKRYELALDAALDYALELIVSGQIVSDDALRLHLEAAAPTVAPWHRNRDVRTDLLIDARQRNLYRAIHEINRPIEMERPLLVAG